MAEGMPAFLTKQYGPFNGITWVGIVGGGAVLAYFLRRSFSGGGSAPKQQAAQQAAPALDLPGTTYHDVPGSDGSGETKTPSKGKTDPYLNLPPPKTSPSPKPPTKGNPGPVRPAPPQSPPPHSKPAPQPKPTPTPQPQKPRADVPGGYPADCSGVLTPAGTATSWQQVYQDKRKAGLGDRMARDIANQTGFMGIANIPGLGQTSIAVYLQNHLNWPGINLTRRNRGMRALTTTEFSALEDMQNLFTAENKGKSLTDAQLAQVWSAFHDSHTCANRPANSGSRANAHIDVGR